MVNFRVLQLPIFIIYYFRIKSLGVFIQMSDSIGARVALASQTIPQEQDAIVVHYRGIPDDMLAHVCFESIKYENFIK